MEIVAEPLTVKFVSFSAATQFFRSVIIMPCFLRNSNSNHNNTKLLIYSNEIKNHEKLHCLLTASSLNSSELFGHTFIITAIQYNAIQFALKTIV